MHVKSVATELTAGVGGDDKLLLFPDFDVHEGDQVVEEGVGDGFIVPHSRFTREVVCYVTIIDKGIGRQFGVNLIEEEPSSIDLVFYIHTDTLVLVISKKIINFFCSVLEKDHLYFFKF
jgi:hypothetical protein